MRSMNVSTTYGGSPGRLSITTSSGRPAACSTWTPASARSWAAEAIARLMRRAPCEPPVTRRVGRSGSSPKYSRASSRTAARSSPEICRRIGSPTYVACGQVGAREAGGDVLGEPRTQLVGDAGDRVALVHDDAAPAGAGPRGRPARRRSRRSRPRRRDGRGRTRRRWPWPPGRSFSGTCARALPGRRGRGTGGTSSSGKPASGIRVTSSPRGVPRQVTSTSRSRRTIAVASSGDVWPAVPPPARRTRTGHRLLAARPR